MDDPAAGGVADVVSEEQLRAALPLLEQVAVRLTWQLGGAVPRDDLLSIGHFALSEIVRRYDPSRSPFEPYLRRRLRWAMLDGVRRETHGRAMLGRAQALRSSEDLAEARQGQAAAAELALPPSEGSHRARLRMALRQHAVVMGIKLVTSEGSETAVTASSTDPERLAQRRVIYEAIWDAVAELDERQRTIVERHYFGGEPFSSIARDLGVSRGWVSRLHAAAVEVLGHRLRRLAGAR